MEVTFKENVWTQPIEYIPNFFQHDFKLDSLLGNFLKKSIVIC